MEVGKTLFRQEEGTEGDMKVDIEVGEGLAMEVGAEVGTEVDMEGDKEVGTELDMEEVDVE